MFFIILLQYQVGKKGYFKDMTESYYIPRIKM